MTIRYNTLLKAEEAELKFWKEMENTNRKGESLTGNDSWKRYVDKLEEGEEGEGGDDDDGEGETSARGTARPAESGGPKPKIINLPTPSVASSNSTVQSDDSTRTGYKKHHNKGQKPEQKGKPNSSAGGNYNKPNFNKSKGPTGPSKGGGFGGR